MKLIFSVACTLARFPAKHYLVRRVSALMLRLLCCSHTVLMTGAQTQSRAYHLPRWVFAPDGALSQWTRIFLPLHQSKVC